MSSNRYLLNIRGQEEIQGDVVLGLAREYGLRGWIRGRKNHTLSVAFDSDPSRFPEFVSRLEERGYEIVT